MEISTLILTSALAIGFLLKCLYDHFVLRHHKTSYVLHALFIHFWNRNEKPIEFLILEAKAKNKIREFEVKTMQQKYYTVVLNRLKVVSTEPINGFSISKESSYMRGVVDPILLNRYEISVKETHL